MTKSEPVTAQSTNEITRIFVHLVSRIRCVRKTHHSNGLLLPEATQIRPFPTEAGDCFVTVFARFGPTTPSNYEMGLSRQ
jgi:hypothetical protein